MACLLGKPPRPTTVLWDVLDRLRAISAAVTVHLPKGDTPLPASLFDAHLVIQRGLGLAALTSSLRLEHAGVRCCNRITAAIAVQDRIATLRKLAESGVPVPPTAPAATKVMVTPLTFVTTTLTFCETAFTPSLADSVMI
jgi:glutathione synthase/RimK-type ligase-like ATP-grasp enzyme